MDRRQFLVLLSAALGAKPPAVASAAIPTPVLPGELRCSFCNRSQRETRKLIAGPSVYICNECIALCTELLRGEFGPHLPEPPSFPQLDADPLAAELERFTDPTGHFPTLSEMRGFSRDQIAALLRERGFAEWDRFDELVDSVEEFLEGDLAELECRINGGPAARRSRLECSFCGKPQAEVKKLIAGPTVYVCDECIALCNDIIAEEQRS